MNPAEREAYEKAEQYEYELRNDERLQAVIKALSNYVNSMGHAPKDFVTLFSREHRTLQQSFTGVCLAWLVHLSQLKEGWYDGRNEASVQIAKKLLKDIDIKYDLNLPFI